MKHRFERLILHVTDPEVSESHITTFVEIVIFDGHSIKLLAQKEFLTLNKDYLANNF